MAPSFHACYKYYFTMSNDILCIANLFQLIVRNEVRYHVGQAAINTSLSESKAREYYSQSDERKVQDIVREGERLDEVRSGGALKSDSGSPADSPVSGRAPSATADGNADRIQENGSPGTSASKTLANYNSHAANVVVQLKERAHMNVYQFDEEGNSDEAEETGPGEYYEEDEDVQDDVDLCRKVVASRDIYSLWVGELQWRATYSSQLTIFIDQYQDYLWFVFSEFVPKVYDAAQYANAVATQVQNTGVYVM